MLRAWKGLRGVAGIADQAFSSASNIFLVLAVARVSTPHDFGIFSFAYVVLTFAIAVVRGALGTPISLQARDPQRVRRETSWATTLVIRWTWPMAAAAVALVIFGPPTIRPVCALAISLPVVLAQDLMRFEALALQRYGVAILADALWASISGALLVSTWFFGNWTTATAMALAWGAFGALSLGVLMFARLRPNRAGKGLSPFDAHDMQISTSDRLRFGFDASMGGIVTLLVTGLVAGILSPIAVAGLRGASTMLGPVNVLISSLQIVVIPHLVRRPEASLSQMLRVTAPVSIPVAVCALCVGLGSYVLPDRLGELALGSTWTVAAPILVVLGVEYVGQSILTALLTILRAKRATRRLVHLRVIMGVAQVTAGVGSALAFGSAVGVAVGSATVVWLTIPFALRSAARTTRDPMPQTTTP